MVDPWLVLREQQLAACTRTMLDVAVALRKYDNLGKLLQDYPNIATFTEELASKLEKVRAGR